MRTTQLWIIILLLLYIALGKHLKVVVEEVLATEKSKDSEADTEVENQPLRILRQHTQASSA